MDTRVAAARVLADVFDGRSLNRVLPPMLDKVSPRDRGLLQQLCYGTLRRAPRLEALLQQLLDKPLRDKDSDVHALLLCGLYQLEETRIPDHAAVSATVGATRGLKKNWAKGMTNAVLRRFLREAESLVAELSPAARDCHPDWLYQALHQGWPEHAASMVAVNNEQPPMVLRVNLSRITRADFLTKLAAADIEARAGELSPAAVYLTQPMDVAALPGFAEGEVSVQDEGAQMAAIVVDPQPGDRILDACAAPGGKTGHLLEMQPDLADIIAMDVDPQRLLRVQENLERLALGAELLEGDGAQPPGQLANASFDRILIDAPCSATGVIRRHPDVKSLRLAEDVAGFSDLQLSILQGLWPLLRPGGTLVYATCSVIPGENDGTIGRFLSQQQEASCTSLPMAWGEATQHGRQLLPTSAGPDGLYYCVLRKN
ncbi:16S rRNA (cytosine(967)-C(5))-methyltransferase RsmB [Halioglobus maricola]|uniref:16S rRNA (cytosine(967)-C(5))-methyltransferase n=2 Tax=Halioglobus maricola TaxID=2601894 RepID=A0A5P9NRN2_9GAMM|nr:16S rRNA (cytosine(967)-C(5))-methyltransferase RsmB [Halioglobus maricola]